MDRKHLQLSIVGFGTVGQGLAQLLASKAALLKGQYGLEVTLVSVANARHGFVYCEEGLHIPTLLELAAAGRPLSEHPHARHWRDALAGLQATSADVLAETTTTNLRDAEPGISHIRAALTRGMHVVTANKGPVALAAPELLRLAQQQRVQLRMEATVMAGTPVLSSIREGMAGAQLSALRGILNGTTNYILSAMAAGQDYAHVLAQAQAEGYAEADPTADVEGYDTLAKTLILAAVVFHQPLHPEQVVRQGIPSITRERVQAALRDNKRIKLIASLQRDALTGGLLARVEPVELPLSDPLARIDGITNAITLHSDTLAEVTIIGPGAGRLQTGQALLADLLAIHAAQH
jgi:homoserine dehydrogenase